MSDADESPCRVCGKVDQEEFLVLCDGCDAPFHTFCHHGCICCQQKPRNNFNKSFAVPEGDWFCKLCAGRVPALKPKQSPLSSVFAWGDNEEGQLGIGADTAIVMAPTAVSDLGGISVRDIAVGESFSIVLSNEGQVYTTGTGTSGQLGHQDMVHEKLARFRKIEGLDKRPANEGRLERVLAGREFAALLSQNGHMYTWGNGESGQLGHQENKHKKTPKKISALREQELPVVLAAAGSDFVVMTSGLAKEDDYFHRALPGVLMTMGANIQGQLGDSTMRNQWVPQLLNAQGPATTSVDGCKEDEPTTCLLGRDVRALATGAAHTIALVTGTLGAWSWGLGEGGQLGHPKPPVPPNASKFFRQTFRVPRPRFIQALHNVNVMQVACGVSHSLFLTNERHVFGCGSNTHGQLLGEEAPGGDEVSVVEEPKDLGWTPPPASGGVRIIGAGDHHSLALTMDGIVFTWGRNDKGQLGHSPDAKTVGVPTKVDGLPCVESIHTAYNSTFAVEFAKAVAGPKVGKTAAAKKSKGKAAKAPAAKRAKK
ncbi:hypothetical protein, variant [Aphanomyces invadans]|uniref:PHD-type domain-containing protein n=1 Tax=Aphanomyces invadans TaxID=157072 RepID=A0A024THG1_9STRA|nr:hypothetical protein, variant [Aphanomyces invadans]ETV92787.1 hypothetical protein, variant [Aphanomyces invadans]|eukprot:XP_008878556.1 hypothetical protein, variant [Aphanomyces invadans]